MKRVTIQYEISYAKETISGDTIRQDLGGRKDPTSDRAFQTITVHKGGTIAPNEAVYLHEIHGNMIFLAYTNEEGKAEFLLPLGKKYMVFFNFQKNVDVIDLKKSYGFATGSMKLHYLPDPKLEHPERFIPKPGELFLVDFKNFLEKQYPKPKQPKKINLFAKWAGKVNANSKEAVLEVGYTANAPSIHLPTNLSLVLDVSGSMAGYYRIERLKESLVKLISSLSPETYLSVITYESEMKVLFKHQKLGSKKNKLIDMVNKVEAGGGTDILEAMHTGYQFIENNLLPNGTNRIVLLTDGYDQNPAKDLVRIQNKFSNKIECSTIGVGEDYNYALLKQLASNGKGMLHFVGESNGFDSVFTKGMGILLNPTAVNATLEVQYNNKLIYKHLYGLQEKERNSNLVDFFLPNIYSGANEVAIVKFDLVKPDESIEKQPVIIRLKYFEHGKKKTKVIEEKVYLEWDSYTGKPELIAEAETKKLYCIAIMNQALKVMAESYASGNSKRAKNTLNETKKQVNELYPKAKGKDINKLMEQLDKYIIVFKNLENKEKLEKSKE